MAIIGVYATISIVGVLTVVSLIIASLLLAV